MHDSRPKQEAVAITGVAGRFSNADNPSALWKAVLIGADLIDDLPGAMSREEIEESGGARAAYVGRGGFLARPFDFDAQFYACSSREALLMDPQQRLFLQVCHEVLDEAGVGESIMRKGVGVFVGARPSSWNRDPPQRFSTLADQYWSLGGNASDAIATRVAYKLGCTGPALSVHTFCSGSLVALQLACQSVLSGQCTLAIAGGVCIRFPTGMGYLHQPGGILSPTGRVYAFDERADGTVFADACAAVTVRRLRDALDDGDPILAVVRGIAVNNDASDRAGFSAPAVAGQTAVIEQALSHAGLEPKDIHLIEAHGTGTQTGDAIEFRALARAFQSAPANWCGLGSIKSNVGHTDCASGIVGLIKAIFSVQEGTIPPTANFQKVNPALSIADSPFYIVRERAAWPNDRGPRRAGISSFGIGGTNVHAIIEEPPVRKGGPSTNSWHALPISARNAEALGKLSAAYAGHLALLAESELPNLAFTLQRGRRTYPRRRMVLARTLSEAVVGMSLDDQVWLPHGASPPPDLVQMATAWSEGAHVDLGADLLEEDRQKIRLPLYPVAPREFFPDRARHIEGN